MKAKIKETKEIRLQDLVIGKGQVRTKDVAKDLDILVESIKVLGLLEPIVVCQSADKPGKYEILTGQRRFLAHKELEKPTILAVVLDRRVDEGVAKAISVTENLVRRDLSPRELIDACTSLYKKYGSIKDVADATGLKYGLVSKYVKYDRLIKPLQTMVDSGKLDVRVALRAQDAASVTGDVDSKEAVKLAKEMSSMSGAQQRKLAQEIATNPDTNVDDAIETAKTGGKITQVIVSLTSNVHQSLQQYAEQEQTTQDEAAATLIEEGLGSRGLL
jgi:ParB family chromosome partitioning protein